MTTKPGWTHALLAACSMAMFACGGTMKGADAGGGGGAGGGFALTDGGDVVAMYPSWQLADIQPQSPRFNQVYGLSAFQTRPVVVVLLEGF